jgi:hypothetical protein
MDPLVLSTLAEIAERSALTLPANSARPPNQKRDKVRERNQERAKIAARMSGFTAAGSPSRQYFQEKEWDGLQRLKVLTIAAYGADEAKLELDRDAKRSLKVLWVWMDDNWNRIKPILDRIVLAEPGDPRFPQG